MKNNNEKALPTIHVSMNGIIKEKLPLPYVHYPSHYGTFFVFSESKTSAPYFCECSISSIINYFKLIQPNEFERDPYRSIFPNSVVLIVNAGILENLQFKKAICHRCNLVPPTNNYCHEMYGVVFVQRFGWYIQQNYFKYGIYGNRYLEDVTPQELVDEIKEVEIAFNKLRTEQLLQMQAQEHNLLDQYFYQQKICYELQKTHQKAMKKLDRKIENITREEFGYKKIGDKWTSETLLFQIVNVLFPDQEIIKHYRPTWLNGLEYDIYIPEIKLALEYQGQQHFFAIEAWGGEKALEKVKQRDAKKVTISQILGIKLLTVDYTEPLTVNHIEKVICSTLKQGNI